MEELRVQVGGAVGARHLVYLPGLHGDWTLIDGLRRSLRQRTVLVEFTYPRTTTWSLADYARAIRQDLAQRQIARGWLLAESFGSQVAWALLDTESGEDGFRVDGLILAGGFVRYPFPVLARAATALMARTSLERIRWVFETYARFARGTRSSNQPWPPPWQEFLERRTEPDRLAMVHRMHLLAASDFRPVAGGTTIPVYHLSGLWDAVVPAAPVRYWLRRHCPGYCGHRTIARSDHNVLANAPGASADCVMEWIDGAHRAL